MIQRLEPGPDGRERILFEVRQEWRDWLEANHQRTHGLWHVSWRTGTGRPRLPYEALIEEALCFGWVDSTARRLDDERTMLWTSPRRKGSVWSAPNKVRVARLEASGLMREAGRQVITRARADGTWVLLEEVEAGIVPDDLAAALDAHPAARAGWDRLPPSAQRGYLATLVLARRPETRAARVADAAARVARGERPGQPRTKEAG